jgi:hypothetical protein
MEKQMTKFTCHVTRADGVAHRVEVQASDRIAAMRTALAGRSGNVSCRPTNQGALILDALGTRMSSFPLAVAPMRVSSFGDLL